MAFRLRVPAPAALAVLALALPGSGHADPIRVLASDARGVTLRIEVPPHALSAAGREGRQAIRCPGFEVRGEPGRPALPLVATMVALPPEAAATVRVIETQGEQAIPGIALQPL